jgi:hypothetical protein
MFHVTSDGETTWTSDAFAVGLLVGVLVGEGHFGGDGKQPQVTLRMHTRHQALFEWIEHAFPGGRLYGPYHHGGRSYYQWMARGSFLRQDLVPILDRYLTADVDEYAFQRYQTMKERYGIGPITSGSDEAAPAGQSAGETTTERWGSSPSE